MLALRAGKGMVLDPTDPDTCSAGSFFINPVLDPAGFAALCRRALDVIGVEPVAWPAESGTNKVSAAWLSSGPGSAGATGAITPASRSPASTRWR